MSKPREPIGWMEGTCSIDHCNEVMPLGLGVKWVGSSSPDYDLINGVIRSMFSESRWEYRDGSFYVYPPEQANE
jgi:hypothetical protein